MRMELIVFPLLLSATASAGPLEECRDSVGTGGDVAACLTLRLQTANEGLAGTERDLRKEMRELDARRGGRKAVPAFERSASAFRNYRSAHCAFVEIRMDNRDEAPLARAACEVQLTDERLTELLIR